MIDFKDGKERYIRDHWPEAVEAAVAVLGPDSATIALHPYGQTVWMYVDEDDGPWYDWDEEEGWIELSEEELLQ